MPYFVIILMGLISNGILFVFFGQKTMRRLRKNSNTKHSLGIEFVSGYDTVNVMTALIFPKLTNKLKNKLKKSPLSALNADAKLLEKHTTRFDRIVAIITVTLLSSSVMGIFVLMFLDKIGVFDYHFLLLLSQNESALRPIIGPHMCKPWRCKSAGA
jgi:branched-subunit amino acid permease